MGTAECIHKCYYRIIINDRVVYHCNCWWDKSKCDKGERIRTISCKQEKVKDNTVTG